MKKVLLVNAWEEFDEAWEYVIKGGDGFPLHHFHGYDELMRSPLEVTCLRYNKHSFWNKLGKVFKIGNLQQQIDCLKKQKDYDLILDPLLEKGTILISLAKALGLLKKPLFSFAVRGYGIDYNHPLKNLKEYLTKAIIFKGTDHLLFLCKPLYDVSLDGKTRKNLSYTTAWGVDLDFFQKFVREQTVPPRQDYVFFTGGTGRDTDTLFRAFKKIDFDLKVIPKRHMELPEEFRNYSNIQVDNSIPVGISSTGQLRQHYYHSLAVAVPLLPSKWAAGFGGTVILESMAMGKPVISTYNKYHPVNVEKEKVGIYIDDGDVQGWIDAVNYLKDHPDKAREMGERGLKFSQDHINYELFSTEFVGKIHQCLGLPYEY